MSIRDKGIHFQRLVAGALTATLLASGVLASFPAAAAVLPAATATDRKTDTQETEAPGAEGPGTEAPETEAPETGSQDPSRERLSITRHRLEAAGESLSYTATAGRLPLRIEGSQEASIFFVSYRRDEGDIAAEARPITFVFNGGPGAASAYLHLGALGPQRLVFGSDGAMPPAPARLAVNQETWLTFTDLVFIDPVGTGYSRRAGTSDETRSALWETEKDLRALAEFIRLYLTRNNRRLSPVFLVGESYGGFRAAALAETLTTEVGVGLNGVVLVSPVLEFSLMYGDDYTLLPWALLLPAYAATALAHERADFAENADDLGEALKAVEAFSLDSYLTRLAAGDGLSEERRATLYKQVARLIGLPADLVARYNGRIPRQVFARQLLASEARFVSLYDGSIAGIALGPEGAQSADYDPVLEGLTAPLTSALVAYVRDDLGYESDLRYELLNRNVSRVWQWRREDHGQGYLGVADDLEAAMSLNRHLHVLIAHGYYDLVTPYFASQYVVDQMALDAAIRSNLVLETYIGGHMFYTRTQARRRLTEDARALYRKATVARADEADSFEPATPFTRTDSAAERDPPALASPAGAPVMHLGRGGHEHPLSKD